MVYPALLPLMRTPRLPVVDWTDAPRADLNGLVRFARKTKSGFCACAITFQTQTTHLFRDVTRDMCWRRLYCEHAIVAAMALYLCLAHTSVLLSAEADFNARQCYQFSVAKNIIFWSEWKGGIRKRAKVSQFRNDWRRDFWSRNLTPITYESTRWFKYDRDWFVCKQATSVPVIFETPCNKNAIFLCYFISSL